MNRGVAPSRVLSPSAQTDFRPLHVRVRALAQRFDAIAIGAGKNPRASLQDVANAQRDAATLHEAADAIEAIPTKPQGR